MQGIYIMGPFGFSRRRPVSKAEVKRAILNGPADVIIEATSLHGGEYDGPAHEYRGAKPIYFVGPDPYTSRKFYGTIARNKAGELTVK
jgi:hypothetical protein